MSTSTSKTVAPAIGGASSSFATGNPLLRRYIAALEANPLRTKQLTSGILSALAEVLAGHIAGTNPAHTHSKATSSSGSPMDIVTSTLRTIGLDARAAKMFIYGSLVSAPLNHHMVGALQRAFAGRTTPRDRILQIIVSQLTVTVASSAVYLASMAVVNGARSSAAVLAVLKAGLWRMLQISWVTSPLAIAFAQRFLPLEMWEPSFTLLRFVLGTYFNTVAKRKQVALARQQKRKEELKKSAAGGAGGSKAVGDEDIQAKAAEKK